MNKELAKIFITALIAAVVFYILGQVIGYIIVG